MAKRYYDYLDGRYVRCEDMPSLEGKTVREAISILYPPVKDRLSSAMDSSEGAAVVKDLRG